ncbi:MAG: hypothetical protein H6526_02980 [Actinobacteria bacterium]|nr:hypothetical protein [Actinomycetota bacterium]
METRSSPGPRTWNTTDKDARRHSRGGLTIEQTESNAYGIIDSYLSPGSALQEGAALRTGLNWKLPVDRIAA